MSRCPDFTHLLVLPRLRVQNANAVSSPLTHGFPSITAFLGLMWALERQVCRAGMEHLAFNAVGVVSHGWQEQVTEGFVKAFRLTRNPVQQDGSTAAIVEEGRIHLELSLVFALNTEHWDEAQRQSDVDRIAGLLAGLRIAGGTVLPPEDMSAHRWKPWLVDMTGDSEHRQANFRNTCLRLLPGFALVARDELLDRRHAEMRLKNPCTTRLDAWLSLARMEWRYETEAGGDKGQWVSSRRKGDGWIVPIPVGYGALSELHAPGIVRNARDPTTPFRFVESLYSVGEWMGVHRLRRAQDVLWYADSQPAQGLYRCCNEYRPSDPFDTVV